MPPKRKSDDIEGPVPLSHVTGSINGYGVASNEESLPDFIGIDCVAVQPLPYHGTPPYGPAWKQKYMIRSNKTQRYLAAQIVDTNERNSLIDVILTEIGDWNPRILPIDVCLCVPQTGKQAVVSKYCNAGTIWHLYQESRRQRKLPPKAFTCHIFLQMLEALLSLSKRSVRHNACSLDNWFLEFPYKATFDRPSDEVKECPVTDLSKLQDALSWFLGQNEDQLLEETDSDNFTTHFMHWRQMISSMCNAGEHIDRKLYEEHVAHMIYQAKFALRNESNFDLPEWMVEYFQEGFNRYPVAERSAKRKRSDDNTKSVLLRSDPTEAFECIGYETRAIVGGGMFGEVKLGRHFTDGRMAALKSSNDRLQEDDSDEHTILGELFPHARINKSLGKHINMPKHGYTTLAHEFCNGNPVGNLLRHAKAVGLQLPQTFICHIFAQLKEGLLHCYQRKIAHRDFDRNNWFFKFRIAGIYDAYPDVVIGDVGLAKRRFVIDDMKLELKELRILLEESPVDTNSKEGPYTLVFKKWIAAFERMAKAFDKAEKKPATGKFETPAELEKIHKEAVNYWLLEAQIPREHHRIV